MFTAIKQTIHERGSVVHNPLVSVLLVGSSAHGDNTVCQQENWSSDQRSLRSWGDFCDY